MIIDFFIGTSVGILIVHLLVKYVLFPIYRKRLLVKYDICYLSLEYERINALKARERRWRGIRESIVSTYAKANLIKY